VGCGSQNDESGEGRMTEDTLVVLLAGVTIVLIAWAIVALWKWTGE
jgi:hypothetical protein